MTSITLSAWETPPMQLFVFRKNASWRMPAIPQRHLLGPDPDEAASSISGELVKCEIHGPPSQAGSPPASGGGPLTGLT